MASFPGNPFIRVFFLGIPLLLLAAPLSVWSCASQLNPHAFEVNMSNQYDLLPTGMMAVRYAPTNEEGSPHVSVHRVLMVLPDRQPLIPEAKDPHYRVIEIDGTVGWLTYLISAHALYYGVGQDVLGFPERTWIDPEEDGLNGNEHINGREPVSGN
jgi:hypothetical protein